MLQVLALLPFARKALSFVGGITLPAWLKHDLLILVGMLTIIASFGVVGLVGKSMIEADKSQAITAALVAQKAQFDDELAKRTAAAVTAALDAQAKGMAALETKDRADDITWQKFTTNLETLSHGTTHHEGSVSGGAAAALNRAHADADRLLERATADTDDRSAP